MYVVEGLEGDRTALIAKVHHAILDGVSGASVLAAFLDLTPRSRVVPLPPEWNPAPLPSNAQMLRHAASSLARQPGETLSTLQAGRGGGGGPRDAQPGAGGAGRAVAARLLRRAADVVQRRGVQPQALRRRSPLPLEDVKLVGRVFEATVNDVILAGVSGGLRRLLAARGE